jgi:hypothetical protein
MKVYVVFWGSGVHDCDEEEVYAYTNVHTVYMSLDSAREGLVKLKDDFYDEIVNDPNFEEEDREEVKKNTYVHGSAEENEFTIDTTFGCNTQEVYIRIVEKEIIE